jgi:hypothetical protein
MHRLRTLLLATTIFALNTGAGRVAAAAPRPAQAPTAARAQDFARPAFGNPILHQWVRTTNQALGQQHLQLANPGALEMALAMSPVGWWMEMGNITMQMWGLR